MLMSDLSSFCLFTPDLPTMLDLHINVRTLGTSLRFTYVAILFRNV